MNLPCGVCSAPVEVWAYSRHLKACIKIKMGHGCDAGELAYRDRLAAFQRNAMANLPAWSPDTVKSGGSEPIPQHLAEQQTKLSRYQENLAAGGTATPETPTPHRPDPWGYYGGRHGGVPEGKTKCAVCNGLSNMYPGCVNCDGKGWI